MKKKKEGKKKKETEIVAFLKRTQKFYLWD